jgi:hypothetical protein
MVEDGTDRPASRFCSENDFTFDKLVFVKAPCIQYTSAGTPWTKWVPIGMPKIPKNTLDVACYLYPSREDAEAGREFGGTGFFVSIPTSVPDRIHIYAVTNWHVAVRDAASVLRINCHDGGTDILEAGPEDWIFDPRFDVAVLPINLDVSRHKFSVVPIQMFARQERIERSEIGPGDDVFMVGRFVDHDGGAVNSPSVRFGNISTQPTPVRQPNGKDADSYCIDMHSRSGYSGSPVFVYRTAGHDLTQGTNLVLHPAEFLFLGLHYAQFPEIWEIGEAQKRPAAHSMVPLVTDGKYVKGLSGMTLALPAWLVIEVLDKPEIKSHRDAVDAQLSAQDRAKPHPVAEAHLPDAEVAQKRDVALSRALNTLPKPRTS